MTERKPLPGDLAPVRRDVQVPTPAGRAWVDRFPTSRSVEDLAEPFRTSVRTFLAELAVRGCSVRISATLRPAERAWLMHWAWRVAAGEVAASAIPTHDPPIPIVWTKLGAREMVQAYGLAYKPSLTSRHIQGLAVDMTISGWSGTPAELHALGRSHGVIKLVSDPPHWSSDGR